MNFYSIVGQCTAFISKKLSQIGFKNIESFKIYNNYVEIISKKNTTTNKKYKYKLTITLEEETNE